MSFQHLKIRQKKKLITDDILQCIYPSKGLKLYNKTMGTCSNYMSQFMGFSEVILVRNKLSLYRILSIYLIIGEEKLVRSQNPRHLRPHTKLSVTKAQP